MPKKRQRNQRGKQQRALQKRTRRKTKVARRAVHRAAAERPERVLRHAREFPFLGCWVQQGWQDAGIASAFVARSQPSGEVVFASFLVDTFCLGLKDTFFGINVPHDEFENEVLPRFYASGPPVAVSAELAHELIYGAIEFAEANGFRPHSNFRRTQWILDPPGTYPFTGSIEFGFHGTPAYIAGPYDNQVAILNRLVQTLGKGNFNYAPDGDPPEGFEDIAGKAEGLSEVSLLWTPDQEKESRDVDADTGLWVPGQHEPAEESPEEEASVSPLWFPGR